MNKINGIVEEVYIPFDKNQDIMFSHKIGFKVRVNNEIIIIEEEQNESNAFILKGDKVTIIKQFVNDKLFIDIEKLGDEEYESL
jgi:hypothetical protein